VEEFRIIYTKYRSLFRDMKELYMCAVKEKYPSIGKKFGGIEHLLKERRPLMNEEIPGFELLSSPKKLEEPIDDLNSTMKLVLNKLKADKNAWPFMEPVNADDVPEYYKHIQFPIDLGTMSEKIKSGYYVHVSANTIGDRAV